MTRFMLWGTDDKAIRHINQAARAALEEGGFLESNDTKRSAKTKGKRKVQALRTSVAI